MTTTLIADLTAELIRRGDMFTAGRAAEIAADWADYFDDACEAAIWMDAGFWDASTADTARTLGIDPENVAAMCNDNITGYDDPVYAMCNGNLAVDAMLYD